MKEEKGLNYLSLALLAFAGLGLEILLVLFVEPLLYGVPMKEWSFVQTISHWVITCVLWLLMSLYIIRSAQKEYGFSVFYATKEKVKLHNLILVFLLLIISLLMSYLHWDGVKVITEFVANGWLKFLFQYIYYVCEVILLMLILVFGQKAFDVWFRKENIPFGGVVLALTSGCVHFLTKDAVTGILAVISCLLYGWVYLLLGRDVKKAFWMILFMFIL